MVRKRSKSGQSICVLLGVTCCNTNQRRFLERDKRIQNSHSCVGLHDQGLMSSASTHCWETERYASDQGHRRCLFVILQTLYEANCDYWVVRKRQCCTQRLRCQWTRQTSAGSLYTSKRNLNPRDSGVLALALNMYIVLS